MEADLAVLDRDITSASPDQITKAKVLLTVASGTVVYENR